MIARKIPSMSKRDMALARKQAVNLLESELGRASARELELRWPVVRAAKHILEAGPMKWEDVHALFES